MRSSAAHGELLFVFIANSWRTHVVGSSVYSRIFAGPLSAPVTKVTLASSMYLILLIFYFFAESRRVLLFNRCAHPYLSLVVCYISRVWSSNEAQRAVKRCHVFWRHRQRSPVSSRISWPADFQILIPWRESTPCICRRKRAANSWYKFLFLMSVCVFVDDSIDL